MNDLPPISDRLSHLPVTAHGYPVPFVAAWTSEHWSTARYDPRLKRQAVFTAGARGVGAPILGLLNEPRQRMCVLEQRCQICGRRINGLGYLPDEALNREALVDGPPVTSEPLCCRPCAEFSIATCPHLGDGRVVAVHEYDRLVQVVDPSKAPSNRAGRFPGETEQVRKRLGILARQHGGLAGYVKLVVKRYEPVGKRIARSDH